MKRVKIVFTDSGLGGLSIMADFAKLIAKYDYAVDLIFFNAQYRRDLGYKKMETTQQVAVFDSVLTAIDSLFKPDIIAIACNTLSVVYLQTTFYKQSSIKVLDIIETGKRLLKETTSQTIIELAMPTTVASKVYATKYKNRIAIASDTSLPDAIENAHQDDIDRILNQLFSETEEKVVEKGFAQTPTALFLGCTHFPIIEDKFAESARENGVKLAEILNPNKEFSKLLLKELQKQQPLSKSQSSESKNNFSVVSRVKFKDSEIKNIANMLTKTSLETAQALRNYSLHKDLF